MTRLKSSLISICLSTLTAVFCVSAIAQQGSLSPEAVALSNAPVDTIYFHNVAVGTPEGRVQPFATNVAGSIRGRVQNETYAIPAVDPQPVAGVRVILRTIENGRVTIVGYRLTDEKGRYDFTDLPAAKYSLEVDTLSIPPHFRQSGVMVSPVSFEPSAAVKAETPAAELRTIQGIVFIDKDGDGKYKAGKDELVSGAFITANGRYTRSDANGSYVLSQLPAGRTSLLATTPRTKNRAEIVFDLASGPVTNRIINVAISR